MTTAYRIAGGAPAGIIRLPGVELCFATRMMIRTITSNGNKRTAPKGTDIFELPFNLILRLRTEIAGTNRSFSPARSCNDGRLGEDGMRFVKSRTMPILAVFKTGSHPAKPQTGKREKLLIRIVVPDSLVRLVWTLSQTPSFCMKTAAVNPQTCRRG